MADGWHLACITTNDTLWPDLLDMNSSTSRTGLRILPSCHLWSPALDTKLTKSRLSAPSRTLLPDLQQHLLITIPAPNQPPLLYLLLRPQLVRVPTLLLPAIRSPRRQTRVAFPTDHLIAVVLAGEGFERGFDDTATETEDQVQCGFLDAT
jgi:hypothetical protein